MLFTSCKNLWFNLAFYLVLLVEKNNDLKKYLSKMLNLSNYTQLCQNTRLLKVWSKAPSEKSKMHKNWGTGREIGIQFPDWAPLHSHRAPSNGEVISELRHCSLQSCKAAYSPSQETCKTQLTSLLSHHNPNSQVGGMAEPKYIRDYKYHRLSST